MKVREFRKLPDEKFLITAEYDPYGINLTSYKGEEKEKAMDRMKENKDYEVLDEIPFWSNSVGFTNKKRSRLYLFDRRTKDIAPISGPFENVSITGVKDGKALYLSQDYTNKLELTNQLYLYDSDSGKAIRLIEEDDLSIDFAEFVGNEIVFAASPMDSYGLNQNASFYKVKSGKAELLSRHDFGMRNSVGSDCRYGGGAHYRVWNDCLYFVATENKSSFIKRLSLD